MVNISRSVGVITPSSFTGDINIIGVGATGSRVVKSLIELGFGGGQIHAYDFDIVEEHNINNQLYTNGDIGKLKVDALSSIIKEGYDEVIHSHNERVTKSTSLSGIVFILTDTMSSRGEIFNSLTMNPAVKLIIETRLDTRAGYIHTINPCEAAHNEFFKESLFSDDDKGAEVSACGTSQTIGHVVDILSGMAMTEFVKYVMKKESGKAIFFSTEPWFVREEEMV